MTWTCRHCSDTLDGVPFQLFFTDQLQLVVKVFVEPNPILLPTVTLVTCRISASMHHTSSKLIGPEDEEA